MKIYRKQNVFDAALDRIRWLFDEFENVIVNVSGGKDSTVILNLALQVAEEKGRLPLSVLFIDQEAEWQAVIDYMRDIMNDPRVNPLWLQVPIRISNGTSQEQDWLYCWEAGAEWIREKEAESIKENIYGTMTFAQMFTNFIKHEYPDEKACYIAGVRTEESPMRHAALTGAITYNGETWGKQLDKKRGHYTFYPIYDWSYTDVWKSVYDNGWGYCKIYDYMYQYGESVSKMRVSNVHHETAVYSLFILQEIEPETWNKIVGRVQGVHTAAVFNKHQFSINSKSELPFMFCSWEAYRDYLLENLITKEDIRREYEAKFEEMDRKFNDGAYQLTDIGKMHKEHINTLLHNDHHFTKLNNFNARNYISKKWREKGRVAR